MNLFNCNNPSAGEESTTELLRSDGLRIDKIVSLDHSSPEGFWYDQAWDEWVLVVSGYGTIRFEDGKTVDLLSGGYLHIPAHTKHCVEATDPDGPTVWLAVHFDAAPNESES